MDDRRPVLVTGGAGYVGSHACKALARRGFLPVTVDSLVTGWAQAVRFGPLVQADLMDRAALDAAFAEYRPVAVLHFAALSQVGESMVDPGRYWRNNVLGSLTLLEAMVAAGVREIVFSSTCATYGEAEGVLTEDSPQRPINAYGSSKRAVEEMLRDFGAAHGLRHVVFRYFNVAGADPEGEIGECHRPETHLIPVILEAVDGKRPQLVIHGNDWPTHDGTCVRDYVHVTDLAEAHVLGLEWLLAGRPSRVFNLGTGLGFSVREVLSHARAATGRRVPHVFGPRRPGDVACLVASNHRAVTELGWRPERSSLKLMIQDALAWHRRGGWAS
jgi:UDP-glucose 4-epimerase